MVSGNQSTLRRPERCRRREQRSASADGGEGSGLTTSEAERRTYPGISRPVRLRLWSVQHSEEPYRRTQPFRVS